VVALLCAAQKASKVSGQADALWRMRHAWVTPAESAAALEVLMGEAADELAVATANQVVAHAAADLAMDAALAALLDDDTPDDDGTGTG
jgi:hypothetical protein